MKTLASALFVAALFVLLMTFSGCAAPRIGLPESAAFEYDVQPELIPAFERAAARITRASGVVLVAAEGGTPVNLFDESPHTSCGDTYITGWPEEKIITDVQIDLYTPLAGCYADLADTLLHELIHSLRRYQDMGKPEVPHSTAGVFTPKTGRPVLEAESLNAICEVVTCTQYNPEE